MKSIISDVCDVSFKRKSDGKLIFTAEAQLASIDQKITENKQKGGIGNGTLALLRSDKEVTLQVRNGLFDSDWMEMSNGVSYSSATNTVYKKESGLVSADGTTVNITGTPKTGGDIQVIAANGTMYVGTAGTPSGTPPKTPITFTGGTAGDTYMVVYEIDVTGNTLTLLADKFSESYEVQYATVEYDPATNAIINDLYYVFDSVLPGGAWTLSFENGKAIAPELSFTVLQPPGTNVIGRVIEVPRV